MRMRAHMLLLVTGCVGGPLACVARPSIEPSPGLSPPDCETPSVVDGKDVTPLGPGDTVEGDVGDGDTYAFCMAAGDWLRFTFEEPQTVQQPVLSVSRGSAEIAENRFYVFEADPAAQLYAPADAVFTLRLSPLSPDFPGGYALTLSRPGDDVAVDPRAVSFGQQVYGTLDNVGDVDEIALPAVDAPGVVAVSAAIAGFFGNGASFSPVVEVVDDAGLVQAHLDFSNTRRLEVPVDAGAYTLRVAGGGGERPFYALEEVSLSSSPVVEEDDAHNGTLAGAQALSLEQTAPGRRERTVVVQLALGDVDVFSFLAVAGETASFSCRAASAGSGARDLQVELFDATGSLLQLAQEELRDHDFVGGTRTFLEAADAAHPAPGGLVYGSVQAGAFDHDVAGRYAICTASAG